MTWTCRANSKFTYPTCCLKEKGRQTSPTCCLSVGMAGPTCFCVEQEVAEGCILSEDPFDSVFLPAL